MTGQTYRTERYDEVAKCWRVVDTGLPRQTAHDRVVNERLSGPNWRFDVDPPVEAPPGMLL